MLVGGEYMPKARTYSFWLMSMGQKISVFKFSVGSDLRPSVFKPWIVVEQQVPAVSIVHDGEFPCVCSQEK